MDRGRRGKSFFFTLPFFHRRRLKSDGLGGKCAMCLSSGFSGEDSLSLSLTLSRPHGGGAEGGTPQIECRRRLREGGKNFLFESGVCKVEERGKRRKISHLFSVLLFSRVEREYDRPIMAFVSAGILLLHPLEGQYYRATIQGRRRQLRPVTPMLGLPTNDAFFSPLGSSPPSYSTDLA